MSSLALTPLIAYILVCMLGMSFAAGIPSTRDLVSSPGIRMTSQSVSTSSAPTTLDDFQDVLYQVDIVLGGQEFKVQLDTGSSDLWVNPSGGNIQTTQETEIFVSETYGTGNVSGNVAFAQLEVGGFTVANQAFLLPTKISNFTFEGGNAGIMGMAFDGSSNIETALLASGSVDTAGAAPIFNILSQNAVPSSFDIALSRANDSDSPSSGTLFIGSHDANFSNVTQQPELPRVAADHWTIALDKMTVNGTAFAFNQSSVSGVPNGKIAAVLDSGFSLPLLPPEAVSFIYARIPGFVLMDGVDSDGIQWVVPCMGVADLSFTFGGVEFPIHYLDLTVIRNITIPVNNKNTTLTYCTNAYQPLTLGTAETSGFDALLGDSFLRNAYVSFNYGKLDTNGDGSFVQMLPTTNFSTALPDFQTSRAKVLASLPEELPTQTFADLVAKAFTKPNGSSSSRDRLSSLMNGFIPIVIALSAGTALVSW